MKISINVLQYILWQTIKNILTAPSGWITGDPTFALCAECGLNSLLIIDTWALGAPPLRDFLRSETWPLAFPISYLICLQYLYTYHNTCQGNIYTYIYNCIHMNILPNIKWNYLLLRQFYCHAQNNMIEKFVLVSWWSS